MYTHDATQPTSEMLAQRFQLLTADATEYALFLVDLDGHQSRHWGHDGVFAPQPVEGRASSAHRFAGPRGSLWTP